MAITNPESFNLSPWANLSAGTVVTPDDIVAPDGTTTADKLGNDSAGGNAVIARFQNQVLTANDPYCCSVFARPDDDDFIALAEGSFDTSGGLSFFDIANGLITTENANHDDVGILYYGGGWYRCWIVYTTITDVSGNFRFYAAESDGDNTFVRDGNHGVHMWGAVVEQASAPSTYVSVAGHTILPPGAGGGARPGIGLGFGKMGAMGA